MIYKYVCVHMIHPWHIHMTHTWDKQESADYKRVVQLHNRPDRHRTRLHKGEGGENALIVGTYLSACYPCYIIRGGERTPVTYTWYTHLCYIHMIHTNNRETDMRVSRQDKVTEHTMRHTHTNTHDITMICMMHTWNTNDTHTSTRMLYTWYMTHIHQHICYTPDIM